MMNPSPEALAALLKRCGTPLSDEAIGRLWRYHRLLRAANPELNLTRIHQFENMVLKHYVDSLLVTRFEALPTPLIDMGTGPGLPGVPLKLARPELELILAEPRGARVEFLERVVAELGLEGVEVHPGKITRRYDRPTRGVITRAVASIPETLERVARCLVPDGRMLFMKGPECDDEIAEAHQTHRTWFTLVNDHHYDIPGTEHRRRLVVYRRTSAPVVFDALKGSDGEDATASALVDRPVRDIARPHNATFKDWRTLLKGSGLRKRGEALVAGRRIVAEMLACRPELALGWVTGPQGPAPPERPAGLTWWRLTKPLLAELDLFGTGGPLLWIRLPDIPQYDPHEAWPEGCTLVLPFQDPENIGAALRSALAFGVGRVILTREAAHPFHPKALRAGGPAAARLELRFGPALADLCGREQFAVPRLALDRDPASPRLDQADWPARFALIAGLEGPGLAGIATNWLQRRRIPMSPRIESLNAAVSVAVALYEWRRGQPADWVANLA
ncbi:16S rRNA (guanine(527)-N(7))-methyltransferase RsmG [Isosphaera pallida]|nr:16S rRNA (guanine(527)-N(7))-methyltransferase RsmG [Isosphaera pallida]